MQQLADGDGVGPNALECSDAEDDRDEELVDEVEAEDGEGVGRMTTLLLAMDPDEELDAVGDGVGRRISVW